MTTSRSFSTRQRRRSCHPSYRHVSTEAERRAAQSRANVRRLARYRTRKTLHALAGDRTRISLELD